MGEFNEAIPYFRKSLLEDSLNNETTYYLAASLSMTGNYEEALITFQTALSLTEPDPHVLYMIANQLGIVYQNLKLYEDSYKSFAEAYSLNPADSKLLYQMAMVKGELKGEKNLEIARRHLKEYLSVIDKKGTTLTKDEIYLKSRSEWFINKITEDLFMLEKPK
jgi:tetratricopeptide (TPR) repeat protein